MNDLEIFNSIGKKVSLDTKAPTVLGRSVVGVMTSILDFNGAMALADIVALHERVYPYLDASVPDNPTMYPYCKIVDNDTGIITVIGLPWINASNSSVITNIRATVEVKLDSLEDVELLRRSLVSNGFEDIKIITHS